MQKPQRKRWAAEAYCVPRRISGKGTPALMGRALLAVFVFSMVLLISLLMRPPVGRRSHGRPFDQ
jgi:hypothetical protein